MKRQFPVTHGLLKWNAGPRLGKFEWAFTFEPKRCSAFQMTPPPNFLIFYTNPAGIGVYWVDSIKSNGWQTI